MNEDFEVIIAVYSIGWVVVCIWQCVLTQTFNCCHYALYSSAEKYIYKYFSASLWFYKY